MGLLTPEKLGEIVAVGCASCGGKRLAFQTYVDARLPLMEGEPVGRLGWAYDGEAFCDGVFEIKCRDCAAVIFEADVCPRCHAEGGLAEALAAENTYEVPTSCPRCENTQTTYFGMVPASTFYEGKRAEKARADGGLFDAGFHGYKAECKHCGVFAQLLDRCMLCEAPAPLRKRL